MLKVLQATAFYLPSIGGIQQYVRELSVALTRRGHRVTILTVDTEGAATREETEAGLVLRMPLDASYHRGLVSRRLLSALLRARGYDAIHAHVPFPAGLEAAALGAFLERRRLVLTHHGTGAHRGRVYGAISQAYDSVARNLSFRAASRVIFLSRSYADAVSLPASVRARVLTTPTPSDTQRFAPGINSAVRDGLGIPGTAVAALWVGSMNQYNRYKGVDVLLRAIATPACRDVHLIAVGDGPLRREWQLLTTQLGIGDRVHFAGHVENELLPEYYAAADLFVLPSVSGPENSPLVVRDALACGLPVIASGLPGLDELVHDGATGWLVPPGDAAALAAAITRLADDPVTRLAMGVAARREAVQNSWERVAEAMEVCYAGTPHETSPPSVC